MPNTKKRQKSSEDIIASEFLKTHTKPYKKQLGLVWLLDVLSVGILIVQMGILASLFSQLLSLQWDSTLTNVAFDYLPYLAVCLLIRPVLDLFKSSVVSTVGVSISATVRQLAVGSLEQWGLACRQFGSEGVIASYVTDEPDKLIGYSRFYVQKMTAVSTPILIALVVATKSPISAMILLLTAPLVPIFMVVIGISSAKKSREQMDALAQMGGRFLDWMRGMNTLVRLSAVKTASSDIEHAADEYRKRTMSVLKIAFLNSAVLEFLSALSIALLALYLGFGLMGILPWHKNEQVVGYETALFILLLVPEFYAPLRRLGAEYHAKSQAMASAKILAPLIEKSDKITHKDPLLKPQLSSDDVIHLKNTAHIVLDGVSVCADDGRVRLSDVSLCVPYGQTVCLMGESGSGKTTIFQVLLGFANYAGRASIAGSDICEQDIKSLRLTIGYLPQTPALLAMSIADNLRLANPNASTDMLLSALKSVGLFKWVQALPKGMDTILTERGGGMSGGQAQRLAIAQLILQDATIWLLDEPTEHLDSQTKVHIHDLLKTVCINKTVLWATHDTPVPWAVQVYHLPHRQQKEQGKERDNDKATI